MALSAFAQVTLPSPAGTIVVYVPTIAVHQQLADEIAHDDPSIVLLPLGESWPRNAPPRRVVALGNKAARWADSEWPLAPVAVALTWSVPPTMPALTVMGRPAEACTARVLRSRYGETSWVVLAAERDEGAGELAAELGGALHRGNVRQLHASVQDLSPGTAIWFRADPKLANPLWLRRLGMLGRRGWTVAGDAPGLSAYGIETPVPPDIVGTAKRLRTWAHRRRLDRNPLVEQLPCQTP